MKKFLFLLLGSTVVMAITEPAVAQQFGQILEQSVRNGVAAAELANTVDAVWQISVSSRNLYNALVAQSRYYNLAQRVVQLNSSAQTAILPRELRPRLNLSVKKIHGVLEGTAQLSTAQENAAFYLYELPRLMVEDPGLSYGPVLSQAAAYYRDILAGKNIDPSLSALDDWARRMSAITGLSMAGTEADIPLIVNSVKDFPSKYRYRTDMHVAFHLMSFGEPGYKAVKDLLDFRLSQGGEIPASWLTISERMRETGHPLYVPLDRGNVTGPITYESPEIGQALTRFSPLNYAINIDLWPNKELVGAYVDMLKAARRAGPLGFSGELATARQSAVSPANRLRVGAAPKLPPLTFPNSPLTLTASPAVASIPEVDQVGVRTAQETQYMESLLQYLEKNIQEKQRLLRGSEEELATLQRRQQWLPFGRQDRARAWRIENREKNVEVLNKEITDFQDRLARAQAAIDAGKSLPQVMSIAYNEPVIETQFYASFPSSTVPGTTELVAAPGARTEQEAQEMSTLLRSLNNYAKLYDQMASQDIEAGVSAVRKTASIVSTNSRTALRESFREARRSYLEGKEMFQDQLNRIAMEIKVGKSLVEVKQLAYTGTIKDVGANQFYVMWPYDYKGMPFMSYVPAPGAKTQQEAWKMEESFLKVKTEDPPWGTRNYDDPSPTSGQILKAITNGASFGQVAAIARLDSKVPKEGPFLLVEPTGGDYIVKNFTSNIIPAPGATTITDAQQMQALLLQMQMICDNIDMYFAYDDGAGDAWEGYYAVRGAIEEGKTLDEVWEIFTAHFVPLYAKW